jgi:hypothetical protein
VPFGDPVSDIVVGSNQEVELSDPRGDIPQLFRDTTPLKPRISLAALEITRGVERVAGRDRKERRASVAKESARLTIA